MDWFKLLRLLWRGVRLCLKVISACRFIGWLLDLWNDNDDV